MLKEEKPEQNDEQVQTSLLEAQQSAQEYLDLQRVLHEINIELFRIDDLDELYRSAVEWAHTRLGFERISMYLLNESGDALMGTYGIDVHGNICDEHGPESSINDRDAIDTFVLDPTRLVVREDVELRHEGEVVGRGWHISAAMWTEDSPTGVIFADNLITGQPLKPYYSELLFAYASIVANLVQRKRFETIVTKRAAEMKTVAEVGTAAATILDTDELLQKVVDLTKNNFNLYHAHIYLLDEEAETLILTSGAGTVGQQMVAEGWQIPLQQKQSLVARAARLRQGVVINDVQSEPEFQSHPLLPDTRAEMAVPLIIGEQQVLGVLDVQSDRLNYFGEEDVSTFMILAAQLAVALQNARLFTQSEERAEELAFINQIVTKINALDTKSGLQFMAEELGKMLQVPSIIIGLVDETGTTEEIVAAHQPAGIPSPVGMTLPVSEDAFMTHVLQTKQTAIVEDVANADNMLPRDREMALKFGVQSIYVIPMVVGQDLIGQVSLNVMEGGRLLTPEQLNLAETTVHQAATAVQNARLFNLSIAREQEFRSLAESSPDNIIRYDTEHRMRFLNKKLQRLLMVTDDKEVIGKRPIDVWPDGRFTALDAAAEQALKSGEMVTVEMLVPLETGEMTSNEISVVPERDINGEIIGTLAFGRDITERKQAEETIRQSETQLTAAAELAQLAYWQYDPEKDIFTFNDQFYALYHTTAEQHGGYELSSAYYAQHFVHPDDLPVVGEEIERALNSTDRQYRNVVEHRMLYADGGVGYVAVTINIDRDEHGKILRYYGATQDITERKQAEEALLQSEAQLVEAADMAQLGYWEGDFQKQMFTFTDQLYALLRTTAEEQGGYQMPIMQYVQNFVHPDDAPRINAEIQVAIDSPDPDYVGQSEHRFIRADGSIGFLGVKFRMRKDEQGQTVGFFGINQDITERKQAEEALWQNRQLLLTVMDSIPQAIFWKDRDLTYLGCNRVFAEDAGLASPKEIVGKTDYDMPWSQHQADLYRTDDQLVLDNGTPKLNYEEPQTTPTGAEIWLRTNKIPMHDAAGNITAVLGTYEDITERKQAEEAIRQSEARLAESADMARLGHWEFDFQTQMFIFTDQLWTLFRTTAEEQGGYQIPAEQYAQKFVHPDDAHIVIAEIQKGAESAETDYHGRIEIRIIRVDGSEGIHAIRYRVIKDEQGRPVKATGIGQDITELKRIEEAIRQSEARLTEATDMAQLAYWDYDTEKDIFTFNDQFYALYHTTAEQHGGYKLSSAYYAQHFVYPDDLPVVGEEIERALSSTDRQYRRSIEHRMLYADGEVGYVLVKIKIDRDEHGKILRYYGTTQDITERKQVEEALKRSRATLGRAQRIAALGSWQLDLETLFLSLSAEHLAFMGLEDQHPEGMGINLMDYATQFIVPDDVAVIEDRLNYAIEHQHDPAYADEFEYRLKTDDGHIRNLRVHSSLLAPGVIFGITQDITERKQAEEALRQSEARLTEAADIARLGHWEADAQTGMITATDQYYALLGTTAEEQGGYQISNVDIRKFVHPDDSQNINNAIQKCLEMGVSIGETENRIIRSDGSEGHLFVRFRLISDEQGQMTKVVGISQDITERKQAEEALRRSEADLSEAFKIAKLAYWELDIPTLTFTFNDEIYDLLRTTAEQEGGYQMTVQDYAQKFVHPDDAPVVGSLTQQAIETSDPNFRAEAEARIIRADGTEGIVLVRFRIEKDAQGRTVKTFGANQDITERKRIEEAIRQSEARLIEATEIAKLAYWEFDIENDQYTFNDQFYALLHTTAEEHGGYQMPGAYYAQHFIHPDDLPVVGAEIEQALNATTSDLHQVVPLEHRVLYADGGIGYVAVTMNINRDEHGNTLRVYGANQDITERKRLEEAIQQEQERVQILLDSISVPFAVTKVSDGEVVYCNEELGDLLGMPHEQLMTHGIPDFYANPSDREVYLSQLHEQGFVNNFDLHMKRVDGQLFWALISGRLIEFQGEPAIITFALDITERREAQAMIARRATELETVANVSTVVATILEPEELLQQVVDHTKERFDLYHAHTYLLNENKTNLILTNGAGEVGAKMVTEGRRIALSQEQSLVARAARNRAGVVINDVQAEPGFLSHPLLPETHAEMAVPFVVGDEVLGVLDVQADEVDRFTPEDINIFTTLASQVAVALQNARRHNETLRALDELTRLQRIMVREGWEDYMTTQERPFLGYAFNAKGAKPIKDTNKEAVAVEEIENNTEETVVPIAVRGELIGKIALRTPDGSAIPERKQSLIQTVAHQVSEALERARLTAQTQQALAETTEQARRRAVLNQTSEQLNRAETMDDIFAIIADNTKQMLPSNRVSLAILDDEGKHFSIVSLVGDEENVPIRANQPLAGSFIEKAVETGTVLVTHDEQPNPKTGICSSMVVPLVTGSGTIGTLNVGSKEDTVYTESDQGIVVQIASILSSVIENKRLLTETQERAKELAFINRVVTEVNMSDIETGLQFMVEELGEILQVPLVNVRLIDDTGTMLKVVAARHPAESPSPVGTVFPIGKDPVNDALQARQTVIIEDVANANMPPQTQKRLLGAGIRSVYMIPMAVGRDLIGSMAMSILDGGSLLTSDQLKLAETTVQQVATAVQNTRLFTQTEQTLAETELLYEIGSRLNEAKSFDDLLSAVVKPLAKDDHVVTASLQKIEADEQRQPRWMTMIANNSTSKNDYMHQEIDLTQLPMSQIWIQSNEPVLVSDMATDTRVDPQTRELYPPDTKSAAILPLRLGETWVGVFSLMWEEASTVFTEADERLYRSLATQLAISMNSLTLLTETEARARREQTLREIGSQIAASVDAETVLRTAVRTVGRTLGLETFIYLDNPETNDPSAAPVNGHTTIEET